MKKKSIIAFSLVLTVALTMVASLVPSVVSHAEGTVLDSVELTIAVPNAGDTVTRTLDGGETFYFYSYAPIADVTCNTEGAKVYKSARRWYVSPDIPGEETGDGTIDNPRYYVNSFEGAFEAGKDYYTLIDVSLDKDAAMYNSISDDVQITLNGASLVSKEVWATLDGNPKTELQIIAKVTIPDDSQAEQTVDNNVAANTDNNASSVDNASTSNNNTSSNSATTSSSKSLKSAPKTADGLPIAGIALVFVGASIIGVIAFRQKRHNA